MKEQKKIPITEWDDLDKPREKLMAKGKDALSDAELIAILLGSGSRSKSAVELAREIMLDNENNLNNLARLSVNDLIRYNGIGEAKAISIVATLELGRRRRASEVIKQMKITSSKDVFEYMQPVLDNKPFEEFWIIMLSRSNRIIAREMVSSGSLTGSLADPKKIYKSALEKLAASLILAHNHPSGSLIPSQSDKAITNKLRDAGKLLDISVIDHIIIGDGAYYSFADEGILN